jgi:hypothetical protein
VTLAGPRGLLALATLAALCAAARYAPVIDDPWDRSTGSVNASTYFGRIEQNYRRFGFREVKGAPLVYQAPVAAGAVPRELASAVYVHHPVLSFWLLHGLVEAGGWSERTFRLLPIAFSSLTAALLVTIVGRHAGRAAALGALALYLTLPMSWYVGAMVSYDAVTLALMLAAFVLHERRPAAAWLAVFLAGQADWIGLAIVPAIVLYQLMTPPPERRLGRALLLGVPACVSVAAHVGLTAWWKGSIGAAFSTLAGAGRHAALTDKGSFSEWLIRQGEFWRGLYTLPVALIAAAALPWLLARRRAATDPLPRTALALLVPAVLHVAIFRDHSFDHEFWWSYAIPYAVLAVVIVVRDATAKLPGRARAVVATAIVAALAINAARVSRDWHRAHRTDEIRDLGRELDRFAGEKDGILFVQDVGAAGFYVRAWFPPGGPAVARVEGFRPLAMLKRDGLLRVDRLVALVPDGLNPEFSDANRARLEDLGTLGRIAPEEVAKQHPAIARAWPGRGLWVLTIE